MTSVSRLTKIFTPEHYDLSITLNRQERRFNGTVTLNGGAAEATNEIRLHSKDLSIQSALIDGKSAEFRHEENDELVLSQDTIIAGNHVVVVTFSGNITDNMNGIYPCYFEVDGKKEELLATQFESHYARQAFPCIDEPEAKATFDVTLTTEKDVTVLGNMPVIAQDETQDSLVTRFQTSPRMSSYLVAWVVGDLQKKTATTKSGVEVSIWSTKAHNPSSLDFALDIATRSIDFFDDYFGVPYPLPKSDHVALPDFSSGAMENWGLITYREIALLVDPQTTSLSTKQAAATVITHELSHQWFGNLVTMQWWNDLWLNESFANMMEYVAVDAIEPDWNIWLDQATGEVVSALRRDSLDGVQSIQIDVNHPDEISTIFDPSIVYAKGGRLLRMLQAYIGDEAMRAGLKVYFEKHKYTNTVADDLWKCLGETSGKDIAAFMNAWMTQPGFPVVTARREDAKITLEQTQFFVGPHADSIRTWPIPLHGVSSQIPESLQEQSVTFDYTDETVFRLNKEGTAHYITRYEGALLSDIIAVLPQLSTVDRLNLLHEQTLLAQAGVISTADLLPLLSAYKDEQNESVWTIMSLAINELKRFVETDEDAEKKLKAFTYSLSLQQYERLGWEQSEKEPENDTKLRSLIIGLALYGENEDAKNTALHLYTTNIPSSLDPELRIAIMAHAVRSKVDGAIDTLLAAYQETVNSDLRDDIAAALTSTKDIETIKQLSELLKDTSVIRTQDFTHWFVWLLRNRYGRTFMWTWARSEWKWIVQSFKGDSSYDMLPRYIAGSLVSREQLTEYSDFFGPLKSEITLARNITIGETELRGKVELIERDTPKVVEALRNL